MSGPWIKWEGGDQAAPLRQRVFVRHRDGWESKILVYPSLKDWRITGGAEDIVAFRVARASQEKAHG